MKNFLDKFFSRSKNLDYISQNLKQITLTTPVNKIFEAINNYSEKSEIRYVGGCIRKVIKKENKACFFCQSVVYLPYGKNK